MNSFRLVALTTLLLPTISLLAEPPAQPKLDFPFAVQEIPSQESIEEEFSLFEEENDTLDAEILALQEELEEDSQSLEEPAAVPVETLAEPPAIETSQEIEMAEPVLTGEPAPEATPDTLLIETQTEALPQTLELSAQSAALPTLQEAPATLDMGTDKSAIQVSLPRAFAGAPWIYTILLFLSISAVSIWLYSLASLRKWGKVPEGFLKSLQNKLLNNQFEDALFLCSQTPNIFSKMIACGIQARAHGFSALFESMQAEGKRSSVRFWQRIGLLNDIAIIAPMIGLLGTVLGMFYAFYDINRSMESIATLFDGLGVSVGTTVAGLVVAILALILHSTAKYRLVKALAYVENEAQSFASLFDNKTSIYKG